MYDAIDVADAHIALTTYFHNLDADIFLLTPRLNEKYSYSMRNSLV